MEGFNFVLIICICSGQIVQGLLVEENLSEIVATLQHTVQSLQSQVRALNNKTCGCGSKTPVFMAALSADLVHCTQLQPVIFDSVKVNQGLGYDNKHGIFRAPVAGMYAFSTTLSVTPNNNFHVAIVKGNATNEIGYLYADNLNIWIERSTTVFTHLAKDEDVWMVCVTDSRIEGDHNHIVSGAADYHSHFSGYLVAAD